MCQFTVFNLSAETPAQSFLQYLNAELHPGPSFPTADVVWGQTERDRVCAHISVCMCIYVSVCISLCSRSSVQRDPAAVDASLSAPKAR